MKVKKFRVLTGAFFMFIFCIKMAISIAPLFLSLDNKVVNAVIMQLEHESKNEKDDPEKDAVKDKKFFDEYYLHHVEYISFVMQTNILHNSENALYTQLYHPVVPTPPPNA